MLTLTLIVGQNMRWKAPHAKRQTSLSVAFIVTASVSNLSNCHSLLTIAANLHISLPCASRGMVADDRCETLQQIHRSRLSGLGDHCRVGRQTESANASLLPISCPLTFIFRLH